MKIKIYILFIIIFSNKIFAQEKMTEQKLDSLSVKLKEVNIVNKKKIFEQKVDRLVFNLSNSIVSHGADAFEALKIIPNVDTSGESLKLMGKSNLGLMIDGRLIETENIKNYLKILRTDNILKIEIITTPPAKYDAEGNSGLINIILKKNKDLGFKGVFGTSYRQRFYSGYSPYTSLNFKSKKIDISSSVSYNFENKKYDTSLSYEFPINNREMIGLRKDTYDEKNASFNINYAVNPKIDFGFIYEGEKNNTQQNQTYKSYFKTKELVNSTLDANSTITQMYTLHSVNLYSDFKIDTIGKKISVNFNYLSKPNSSKNDLQTTSYQGDFGLLNSAQSDLNLFNGDYRFYSSNIDVTLPIKIVLLEFGAKVSFIKNNSEIIYYNILNKTNVLDESKSNLFKYEENNNALYFSATKEINKKWSTKFGLRYENTNSQGTSITLNQTNNTKFNNLFPSAFIIYSLKENHSLALSYSKRIDRPRMNTVNPFRIYQDNYSYIAGNPFIRPSIIHNFELTYTYKNNFRSNFYVSKTIDGIGYLSKVNSFNNIIITEPDNYFTQSSIGLNLSHTLRLLKGLESYNSGTLYYTNNSSNVPIIVSNYSGYGAYVSTRNTISINRKSVININFRQNFPSVYEFRKSQYSSSFDVGYRTTFLNDNCNVTIAINDMFSQDRRSLEAFYIGYKERIKTYSDMRHISFSISYNFGKNTVKNSNQEKYVEEKNRLN